MTPPAPDHFIDVLKSLLILLPIILGILVAWRTLTSRGSRTTIEGQPIDVNVHDPVVRRSELLRIENELANVRRAVAASESQGEQRAVALHNRINTLVENTASIKGRMEAFTSSLEAFTKIVGVCTERKGQS